MLAFYDAGLVAERDSGSGAVALSRPRAAAARVFRKSVAKFGSRSWTFAGLLPLVFLACGLLASPPALAQTEVPSNWPLIPSGLSAGDQFRLMVVIEERGQAQNTTIAHYNDFVQTEISQNGHGSIRAHASAFRVLGSTAATSARSNTGTTGSGTDIGIYWLNGAKLADDYDDFYDGSWTNKSASGTRTAAS